MGCVWEDEHISKEIQKAASATERACRAVSEQSYRRGRADGVALARDLLAQYAPKEPWVKLLREKLEEWL